MRRLNNYDKEWLTCNIDKLAEMWFAEHVGRSEDTEEDKTLRECMRSPFREQFQFVKGYVVALGYNAYIDYSSGFFYIAKVDECGFEITRKKYFERNFEDWREE